MRSVGLYLAPMCGLLLAVTPVGFTCLGQEPEEKTAAIDREISQLEQQRATELLFCLQLLTQKKDYALAAEQAFRILITPPSKPEELAMLKEFAGDAALGLLRSEKAPKKAADLCERLTEHLGEDAVFLYIASLAQKELGNEARQKEFEHKARSVRSEDQEYWFNVGSFFAKRKEPGIALEGFGAAAALCSDTPTHYNADSEAAMASTYSRLGDYEEALRHCRNLQEIARKIIVSRGDMASLTAMVYAEKAREAEIDEKYDQAIEDYRKSAEVSPQPAAAYNSIGELYLKMSNYEEAEGWFNRAMAAGGSPMAYAGLGDVRKAQGKTDQAEAEYEKCEKAFAEEIQRGALTAATSAGARTSVADPRPQAAAYNNLAWFYATHDRKLDEGVEMATKALELVPDFAEYLDTLAELYYRKGDREAAIREIKKAIALDPPHMKYYQKQFEKFQKGQQQQKRDDINETPAPRPL